MPSLFENWSIGPIDLKHRVVLAPLTRVRADLDTRDPIDLMGEYYEQRTSDGGLIITEATYISEKSGAHPGAPGLYTSEHVTKWKRIVDRVHAKGGKIVVQLWASGWTNDGKAGIPIVSAGDRPMAEGKPAPHALTEEEIQEYIKDHVESAKMAMEAGFDGIELHGAHGYLINQFFSTNANNRTDRWGGSLENRARFGLEILKATSAAIGAGRVGMRLSPFATAQGVYTDESPAEHLEIFKMIKGAVPDLGYLHVVEPRGDPGKLAGWANEFAAHDVKETLEPYREVLQGTGIQFLSAGGYTPELAKETAEKYGGGVVFGRLFISNPDLPERIKNNWPLQKYDRPTFYSRGEKGYTDYGFYSQPPTQPPSPPNEQEKASL